MKTKRIQQAAQQPGGQAAQPSTYQQSEKVYSPLEKKKLSSVAAHAMAALEDEDDIIELSSDEDEDEPPSRPVVLTGTSKGLRELQQQKWDDMFQCLLDYIEETRKELTKEMNDDQKAAWVWDGKVPRNYKTPSGKALGTWVTNQRVAKKNGTLKEDREVRLVSTGLNLEMQGNEENHQQMWDEMFQCLLDYIEETRKEKTEHMNDEEKAAWVWNGCVPVKYKTPSGKSLGRWVSFQRETKKNGKLKDDREARLVKVGFEWNAERYTSDTINAQPQAIAHPLNSTNEKCNHHGDDDVVPSHSVLLTDTSKCHAERLQQKWDNMFQCLLMYIEETRKEETANMNDEQRAAWVWNGCISSNQKLGSWVSVQRKAKRDGKLKEDREARLVSAGVNLKIIPRKSVFLSVPSTTNATNTKEKCNHPGGCLYPAIEGKGLCLNHYKPPQAAAQQPSSNDILQRKMANARGKGLGLSLLVPLGSSISRMKNSAAESQPHNGHGITQPGNNDCLFGRDTWINNYPGNKRYQQIIEENRLIYQVISKNEKKTLRLKIVNDWRAQGGRFLKLNSQTKMWEDIGDDKAQQYISLALREEDSTLMKAVATEQQQAK